MMGRADVAACIGMGRDEGGRGVVRRENAASLRNSRMC